MASVEMIPPRVDLRACGGTLASRAASALRKGRSPRVRRNPHRRGTCRAVLGSISARAEEPARSASAAFGARVDLRACGGTAAVDALPA